MNKQTIGTQTIYTKKSPVRKNKIEDKNKKYYEPLYGTPECTYSGKKRGRKSEKEKEKPILMKFEKKNIIIYFD
tara:strand:- start:976 stop:1197 length:222 start_codon:yes stop_codon:yes gene_type:complete